MKKNKGFLLYIFSITLCCLTLLFFNVNKINAENISEDIYTCIDTNTLDGTCSASTVNFYYRLDKLVVNGNETEITIPTTYSSIIDGVTLAGDVKEINTGFISVTSNGKLSLDKLVLPERLVTIKEGAFTNIATLKEMSFPLTVETIGANLFSSGSEVIDLYLNEYVFGMGEDEKIIDIDANAFANIKLDKFICRTSDMYNFLSKNDVKIPLTLKVKYNFYAYESSTKTDILDSITYYAGTEQVFDEQGEYKGLAKRTFGELPIVPTAMGLDSLGWRALGVEIKDTSEVIASSLTVSVYPKYKLKDIINFTINAKDISGNIAEAVTYNGGEVLTTVSIAVFNHDILTQPTFKMTANEMYHNDHSIGDKVQIDVKTGKDSGKYYIVRKYEYTYEGVVYKGEAKSNTINISFKRGTLNVIVKDVETIFGTLVELDKSNVSYKGLLGNDKVLNITLDYPKENMNAGKYLDVVKVVVNDENIIENYDIIYSYGDYTVGKKEIKVAFNEEKEFTYGESISVSKEYSDTVEDNWYKYTDAQGEHKVVATTTVKIVVGFQKSMGKNAGEYTIDNVTRWDNENYIVYHDGDNEVGKVIINEKEVVVLHKIGNETTYNGEVKKINVYYNDVNNINNYFFKGELENQYRIYKLDEENLSWNEVNEVIDAGNYKILFNNLKVKNYSFTNLDGGLLFEIERAEDKIQGKDLQRFTYTGKSIKPLVWINNDEQTLTFVCKIGQVKLEKGCIDANNQGEKYTVEVSTQRTTNYEPQTIFIDVVIEKVLLNIKPKLFTFYYNEEVILKEEIIVIRINDDNEEEKETLYIEYKNPEAKDIGIHNIKNAKVYKKEYDNAKNEVYIVHNNYDITIDNHNLQNKINIVSRPANIVFYNYENIVYTGKEQFVGARLVDALNGSLISSVDVKVVADEGKIRNAGIYHLRAYFTSEYYYAVNSNLLTIEVKKAKYDFSNIVFNDKEFKLDFDKHYIYVSGELPEGVSVKYTIKGEEKNSLTFGSEKVVTATFIGDSLNYEDIEIMKATISIDMTWLYISIGIFLVIVAIAILAVYLYLEYRSKHPKKIKLKIKNLFREEAEEKKEATSVKEVLGDEIVEIDEVENEDDLVEDPSSEKSFIDRIYGASSELKYYYSEVKNELLSYDGITHTVDRRYEVFYHGTRKIAKLSICNNVLRFYVNLDPDKYDKEQYSHRNMSKFEEHAHTPLRIDVNTTESLRHAKVFIRILRRKENLKSLTSFVRIDYEKFYTLKEKVFPRLYKKFFPNKKKKG